MPNSIFMEKSHNKGYKYKEYFEQFEKIINSNDFVEKDGHDLNHVKLNYQRTSRINKSYNVDASLCAVIKNISVPQIWMVVTENWCGDSAQTLPYIAKMAECNSMIDLRIIERDKNLDIIDHYLTNGTRSIPKLIAFDKEGNELFQWGPRPKEAVELVNNAKAEGKNKEEFLEMLHLWYGRNRGKALEKEFHELIISNIPRN